MTHSRGLMRAGAALWLLAAGLCLPAQAQVYNPTSPPSSPSVIARPPSALDDAAHGYRATDIWYWGGQLYQPLSTTAGQALWVPLANGASGAPFMRPCDPYIATSNAQWCGGMLQMVSGYVGPAVVAAQYVAGTWTQATINILPSGQFDYASLYAFLEKGTQVYPLQIQFVYDQRPGATNTVPPATQPNPDGPWVGTARINGHDTMCSSTLTANQLALPSYISVAANNFFVLEIGRRTSSGGATPQSVEFSIGNGTSGANTLLLYGGGTGQINAYSVGLGAGNLVGPAVDSSPAVYSLVSTSSALSWGNNEEITSFGAALSAATLTGGELFSSNAAPTWTAGSCITGFMVANAAGTAAQQANARRAAYVVADIQPQVRDQIVTLGDSTTFSYTTDSARTWPNDMQDALLPAHPMRVFNLGVPGITSAGVLGSEVPVANSLFRAGARNIATVLAGTNDLGTLTPAAIVANLQSICTSLTATGFQVVLVNILPRGDAQAANATALRAAIAAATFAAVKVVDPASVAALATPTNTTYFYTDFVHETNLGEAALGALMAASIAPWL